MVGRHHVRVTRLVNCFGVHQTALSSLISDSLNVLFVIKRDCGKSVCVCEPVILYTSDGTAVIALVREYCTASLVHTHLLLHYWSFMCNSK